MTPDEAAFFPSQCLPLYDRMRDALLQTNPDTVFDVKRTQISLYCGRMYGCVSLPRRKRDIQAGCLLLTFGLPYHADDARILQAAEPYPNRWTHHLLLHDAAEIDSQLLFWFREACAFAARP